jgi:DNA-binding transcriptional ArsR family regulator
MPEKISDPEQALLFLLRHPLRRELLRLYVKEGGSLSPKQLSDFTKKHLSLVGYHVRALAKHGAVELVGTQPRRGPTWRRSVPRASPTRMRSAA